MILQMMKTDAQPLKQADMQ